MNDLISSWIVMKDLRTLDHLRRKDKQVIAFYGWAGDETCGVFNVMSPIDQSPMTVIASSESGWDHVSASRPNRCPNWPEMDFIKRLFFENDEVCMQLHVASKDHISIHDYTLHIWATPSRWLCPGRFLDLASSGAGDGHTA